MCVCEVHAVNLIKALLPFITTQWHSHLIQLEEVYLRQGAAEVVVVEVPGLGSAASHKKQQHGKQDVGGLRHTGASVHSS